MPIPELCERLQDAWISHAISESTWGYPVVGALHVLAFALFGGAILIPAFRDEARWVRRIGMTLVMVTGILLFAAGAGTYYNSTSFRIKLALLALIVLDGAVSNGRQHRAARTAISLALWAAVVFASRGIAFF